LLKCFTRQKNDSQEDVQDADIQLAKKIILNSAHEPGPHLNEGRERPPGCALTMIGRNRLENAHELLLRVIQNRIPGDLIETGVWRGKKAAEIARRAA
jgi:hypothetical protein